MNTHQYAIQKHLYVLLLFKIALSTASNLVCTKFADSLIEMSLDLHCDILR